MKTRKNDQITIEAVARVKFQKDYQGDFKTLSSTIQATWLQIPIWSIAVAALKGAAFGWALFAAGFSIICYISLFFCNLYIQSREPGYWNPEIGTRREFEAQRENWLACYTSIRSAANWNLPCLAGAMIVLLACVAFGLISYS